MPRPRARVLLLRLKPDRAATLPLSRLGSGRHPTVRVVAATALGFHRSIWCAAFGAHRVRSTATVAVTSRPVVVPAGPAGTS